MTTELANHRLPASKHKDINCVTFWTLIVFDLFRLEVKNKITRRKIYRNKDDLSNLNQTNDLFFMCTDLVAHCLISAWKETVNHVIQSRQMVQYFTFHLAENLIHMRYVQINLKTARQNFNSVLDHFSSFFCSCTRTLEENMKLHLAAIYLYFVRFQLRDSWMCVTLFSQSKSSKH